MKLENFIAELKNHQPFLDEKEIKVIAPNGLEMEPKLKFVLKDKSDVLNYSISNIEKIIISFD
jgi:hypothetical protein